MKAIIDWLITIEHLANKFYSEASNFFNDDIELKTFLQHLSEDEAEHYHTMVSAAHYIANIPPEKAQIEIDDSIKSKIESPFRVARELLDKRIINSNSVIDCIVESEFSEWNDLFIYVINTLKTKDIIYKYSELKIQRHMRAIDYYLNKSEYGRIKLQEFTKLPYAKKEKLIIVDDDKAIAELLAAMLEDICESDFAENGAEALEKIKMTSYDLVISDINMPVMDGLELYKNSESFFVKPNDSFIFHTGNMTNTLRSFFETNNIIYMEKPYSITGIRKVVNKKFHLD
ncbi:MAG: response regulator [Desulfuromonadales bacterium]|nr:response regulator [Desulfuromonadales bacterium]